MIVPQVQRFLTACRRFPWLTLFRTLHQRFREDRLGQTAGSLTFTTTIALVPLFTVALAVFTVFPMFGQFQNVLQRWLIESLVPDSISRQVLGYLTQFSSKASRLGVVGVLFLLVSAITLVFTIDRSLNAIWRVRTRRPWAQRVLLYWAAITLGPLLMAASVMMMSYVVSVSRGVVSAMPSQLHVLLDGLEFLLLIGGVSALYKYVPYVHVPWRHALLGGTLVTLVTELARRLLTLYLASMPAYSTIYGAFATLPILLIWIYTAWVIVLAGAVFVANLPSLLGGRLRQGHAGLAVSVGAGDGATLGPGPRQPRARCQSGRFGPRLAGRPARPGAGAGNLGGPGLGGPTERGGCALAALCSAGTA